MSRLKGFRPAARRLPRRRGEARMEEEFQFHIEMETARLREGLSPYEARRRARSRSAGSTHTRSHARRARRALVPRPRRRRSLRVQRDAAQPRFAIAVALTLGIGIGVNGAIFGYVNSILLRRCQRRSTPTSSSDSSTRHAQRRRSPSGTTTTSTSATKRGPFRASAGRRRALTLSPTSRPRRRRRQHGLGRDGDRGLLLGARHAPRPAASSPPPTRRRAPIRSSCSATIVAQAFQRRPRYLGHIGPAQRRVFTITGVAPPGFRGIRPSSGRMGADRVCTRSFSRAPLDCCRDAAAADARLRSHKALASTAIARKRPLSVRRAARVVYPASNANLGVSCPGAGGFENPEFVKPRVLALSSALAFSIAGHPLIICANLANLQLACTAARARDRHPPLARLLRGAPDATTVRRVSGPRAPGPSCCARPARSVDDRSSPNLQFQVGIDPTLTRACAFPAVVALLAIVLFGLVPALRA